MDLGITGRRAAVAAGTAGLGLAAARALAEEGAEVVICGRDPERLSAAAGAIGATGVVCDVGSPEGGAEFVAQATEALGGVDILVANGGGPPGGGFDAFAPDDYAAAFAQNCLATIAMCRAAVPGMRERGWGRVVAITSIVARQAAPHLILSTTVRAGLTAFLKTLAVEVAAHGVTVNAAEPGFHATDRIRELYAGDLAAVAATVPAGVLGRPEDFGRVVAFLCSEPARFVTGTGLLVDGGQYPGIA